MDLWEAVGFCGARNEQGLPCTLLRGHSEEREHVWFVYPEWYLKAKANGFRS